MSLNHEISDISIAVGMKTPFKNRPTTGVQASGSRRLKPQSKMNQSASRLPKMPSGGLHKSSQLMIGTDSPNVAPMSKY